MDSFGLSTFCCLVALNFVWAACSQSPIFSVSLSRSHALIELPPSCLIVNTNQDGGGSQSTGTRQSHGKIEDCEESTKMVKLSIFSFIYRYLVK